MVTQIIDDNGNERVTKFTPKCKKLHTNVETLVRSCSGTPVLHSSVPDAAKV